MQRHYVPYPEVGQRAAIHVDSYAGNGLTLSHWKGATTPESVLGDTSVDSVLNALRAGIPGLELTAVTASHWDIDGFVGLWCLFNEELALRHDDVLRQVAAIGDFGEFDPNREGATQALKLVYWLNTEGRRFYGPFRAESERVQSVDKFAFFLPRFWEPLQYSDRFRNVWLAEYEEMMAGYRAIHSAATRVTREPDLGLIVIETPEPVHYNALLGDTAGYDIVLAMYGGNRYELEYKYTTWVDLASRPVLPRIEMGPLAARLNASERSGYTWVHDPIADTGPILRLDAQLSRAQRFDSPSNRPIHASSLAPETLKAEVIAYYRSAFAGVAPRLGWTWGAVRDVNQALSGTAS
ncbi:MAG: hypothetical protein EXR43_04330 [Dehalococcoidia bacterium]|nr:hypothetical protein [Dehalococcoidia bacterium]